MKITHLRVYKPDGELLEFAVGDNSKEGFIDEICLFDDGHVEPHPRVTYERQKGKRNAVEAHFVGFPYSYRSE